VKLAEYERRVAAAMRARDPAAAMRAIYPAVDGDGVRMTALLVARLRFERLLRGSPEAEASFDRDAAAFARDFERYHREVAPTAFFPVDEAALWRSWRDREPQAPPPARSRIVARRRGRR
jgi:hypothetical protein